MALSCNLLEWRVRGGGEHMRADVFRSSAFCCRLDLRFCGLTNSIMVIIINIFIIIKTILWLISIGKQLNIQLILKVKVRLC